MAFRHPQMLSKAASMSFLSAASRTSRLATRSAFTSSSRASSSSTSALAYKALHRRSPLTLPVTDVSQQWDAQTAVSSILYETPVRPTNPPKRHVLNCLVQNEPGVLSRVSGILAARGFNIDSLVVCNTEVEDLSRMTIVLQGQDGVVEQARRQLDDLVPVWAVLDYTDSALVQRELLLAKVSILGPEYFEELLQHHREITTPVESMEAQKDKSTEDKASRKAEEYHPRNLPSSQALRHKHEHLDAITRLTHQFGGKVLDISTNNCIVELSAKPSRIDSFMKLISPFGILESTRTGLMALPRSPLFEANEELEKEAADVVDASTLPPG
ncbi:small subunit of acetolactate synthase-domain-containing protein [Aspergillus desertorum]